MSPDEPDRPVVRASDAEREAVAQRLQTALGEGRLDLDEFGRRVEAAYSVTTTADLDALLADLPRDRPVGERGEDTGNRPLTGVFGDIRVVAGAGVPERAGSVFGDVVVDLRQLRIAAPEVHLQAWTVFGDVDVIVGEGVAAELTGWTVLGDRRVELAPVPRLAGTPRVVVTGRSVFGDLRLRSLPPGMPASRWRALLQRLAGPPQSPPPGT